MYLRSLALVGLGGFATLALAEDIPRQEPTAESLERVVAGWQQSMVAEGVTTRLDTLDAMSPAARDVAVMFPQHAEKLGRYFELLKRRQAEGLASADPGLLRVERVRQSTLRRVRAIDVRAKESKSHNAVLELLPRNIPVYRVILEYDTDKVGSSSYAFVNGRWIYLRDLTSIPELLPKLDSVLQQLEQK